MQKRLYNTASELYATLHDLGIAERRCVQLANLAEHCKYSRWCVDSKQEQEFIIVTLDTRYPELESYAEYAREHGATLCIMSPYDNRERWEVCHKIINAHPSTTVDNRAYLLIFNNHLPKQRFKL
jgi:hypothetical protein